MFSVLAFTKKKKNNYNTYIKVINKYKNLSLGSSDLRFLGSSYLLHTVLSIFTLFTGNLLLLE